MKAILVVDIPDDVEIEDCEIEYSVKEQVMLTQVAKGKTKLKPMPEPMPKDNSNEVNLGFELGWNNCLEEILNTGLNCSKEGEELGK